MDYLATCAQATHHPHGKNVAEVRTGVAAVLSGAQAEFNLDYPCPICAQTCWRHMRISRLQDAQSGAIITYEDTTERKHAEESMREALVVFNAVHTAILTTDAAGIITSVNPAFSAITGYAPEEVIGRNPSLLKSGRHDVAYYRNMRDTLAATGRWEAEIWNKRKNGEIYPQWQSITAVRDDNGNIVEYVAVFSDITVRKQQEEIIWRQANFDALTGLANRNLLRDRIEQALAQARRNGEKVGVIFLDLDGFKEINDTLGHDAGDELLIEASLRLKACVRGPDTVARMGGDEFTIIAPGLNEAEDLRAIGEKLVNVLRESFTLSGNRYKLSGSIGIAVFPDHGEDVQTLLKNADIAMYQSKQAGKDCFTFFTACPITQTVSQ
jgi:diguanylate cyclase (GGDEF)-like protein/PAS domain S-box-containing protein